MLLLTAKLFVHAKAVFLNHELSPSDLAKMSYERQKELLPFDHMDPKSYPHDLQAIENSRHSV
jgi:hypothetical protein